MIDYLVMDAHCTIIQSAIHFPNSSSATVVGPRIALFKTLLIIVLTLLPFTVVKGSVASPTQFSPYQIREKWESVRSLYDTEGLNNNEVVLQLINIYRGFSGEILGIIAEVIPSSSSIKRANLLINEFEEVMKYIMKEKSQEDEEKIYQRLNSLLTGILTNYYDNQVEPDDYIDVDLAGQRAFARMDVLSRLYYYKALFSAYDNKIADFEDSFTRWIGALRVFRSAYQDINELYHCYLYGLNMLGTALGYVGQSNYGLAILSSIALEDTNTPFEDTKCDNYSNELREAVQTTICRIAVEIGDYATIWGAVVAHTFGSFYYDINHILEQRSYFFQAFPEYSLNEGSDVVDETLSLIENGYGGKQACGIWRSACYSALGSLYLQANDLNKAKEYIEESLLIDSGRFLLSHHLAYAMLLSYTGDYALSLEEYKNCLEYIDSYDYLAFSRYRNDIYEKLCLIELQRGDYDSSIEYSASSLALYQETTLLETRFLSPSQLYDYVANTADRGVGLSVYAKVALADSRANGTLYNAALFHKNSVVRMCNQYRAAIINSGDEALIEKYYYYLELAKDRKRLMDELELTEIELALLYSKHPAFDINSTLTWEDVQAKLKKGEVAIEFFNYFDSDQPDPDYNYAALVIKPGYTKPAFIELCHEKELSSLWRGVSYGEYPKLYEDSLIDEASTLIWGKLEGELKGVKTIYYSPYQILSQINLDVLLDRPKGKNMNERYTMIRLSSTGELCNMYDDGLDDSILLMGGIDYGIGSNSLIGGDEIRGLSRRNGWDELSGTGVEINAISKVIPENWDSRILTGRDAKEEVIINLSGDSPSIIHFATHGFYMPESVARTWAFYKSYDGLNIPEDQRIGIVLASANPSWLFLGESGNSDGTLSAYEIAGLDLSNTNLVTISACQSGMGEWYLDGSYGLQRAFKIAGCQTLIMSLWPVADDATQLFMQEFYKCYFRGEERHRAFYNAQKTVRKKYVSPRDWAAFIMLD